MRTVVNFCDGWQFAKTTELPSAPAQGWEAVTLPHTWNAQDGQDGGNDYWRGTAMYVKQFDRPNAKGTERVVLEFLGAAMTAEVYLNGHSLTRHEGGYSTFRVDITDVLEDKNLLCVSVDNDANDRVYPQKADFTFYGGLYRGVNIIIVPAVHFSLCPVGTPGIHVTPKVSEDMRSAEVAVKVWVEGSAEQVTLSVDGQTQTAAVLDGCAQAVFHLESVHLWDGVDDPYLYTASAYLDSGDEISTRFGCRTFRVDARQGFILNDRSYPLCGAARHQDRQGLGNAISMAEHEEDIALLLEMGANTVRLAHYQHAQEFYDLCDETGLIVWAEIPYITAHMENGRQNTFDQMRELVTQCYNHPSIVCWGLSNEITAHGGVTPEIVANHHALNNLCHQLDPTRPTTMAHAFMLDPDDPFVLLPDICSYNLYYGWYLGELEANDQFFDNFHAAHPDAVIGLSEYGADANPQYQSPTPSRGDWTESYQAVYHEHMLKMWSERPYIWAMHCWNMFDFGADGREEGGKPGQNQKGLVTFDRKTKKDAFYLYKAYLSKEPFVHLCGSRHIDRPERVTTVKVYSNQPCVTLTVDGVEFGTQTGAHIFTFEVPISGEHHITASVGTLRDSIIVRKVEKANPDYANGLGGEVVNWFDKPEELIRPGYFSIMDTMADIKKDPQAGALLAQIMAKAKESYGDVAKGVRLPEKVQQLMDLSTLQSTLKQAGKAVTPAMIQQLNAALNQIPKVKA